MFSCVDVSLSRGVGHLVQRPLATIGLTDFHRPNIKARDSRELTRNLTFDSNFNLVILTTVHTCPKDIVYTDVIPASEITSARLRETVDTSKFKQLRFFCTKIPIHDGVSYSRYSYMPAFQDEHGNIIFEKRNGVPDCFVSAHNVFSVALVKPVVDKKAIMVSRGCSDELILAAVELPTESWVSMFNITQQEISEHTHVV